MNQLKKFGDTFRIFKKHIERIGPPKIRASRRAKNQPSTAQDSPKEKRPRRGYIDPADERVTKIPLRLVRSFPILQITIRNNCINFFRIKIWQCSTLNRSKTTPSRVHWHRNLMWVTFPFHSGSLKSSIHSLMK